MERPDALHRLRRVRAKPTATVAAGAQTLRDVPGGMLHQHSHLGSEVRVVKDVRGLRRVRGREHGHRGQYAGLQRDGVERDVRRGRRKRLAPNATADVGANTAAAIAAPDQVSPKFTDTQI